MHEYYDIIIIGAGPAGLSAGLHAQRCGTKRSILLIDKVTPWEHTIQCAEAVGRRSFEEAIDVRPDWIRRTIGKASFHAPSGVEIIYADKNGGYIIDRAAMQRDLAHDLVTQGVTCRFDRTVTHCSGMKSFRRTVTFADGTMVHGRVIIDASGPIVGLGREDAVRRRPPDLEPACFVLAEGFALPPDTVHIYMSKEFAPGGYAWVFPRNAGANIGIVVGAAFKGAVNIRRLLDAFVQHHFPAASVVNRFAGAIPCAAGHPVIAAPGFLKAGDAASTVNPISRAGITEALLCGGLAGDHALAMLDAPGERALLKIARNYETAWRKKRGDRYEKLARIKPLFAEVPDEDYSRAAETLARAGQGNLTMFRIFKTALGRFPRLVWGLRHLI